MVNWKYILTGIVMMGAVYFFMFTTIGDNLFRSIAGSDGVFGSYLGMGLIIYLIGLVGFITIIIGIFKEAPRKRYK